MTLKEILYKTKAKKPAYISPMLARRTVSDRLRHLAGVRRHLRVDHAARHARLLADRLCHHQAAINRQIGFHTGGRH